MAEVKITVRRNGPLRIEAPAGGIELVDADGSPYDLTAKVKDGRLQFSLCRCGGSVNKPFCDGTHSKIGFLGAESAVKAADQAQSGTTAQSGLPPQADSSRLKV
jgi:CDGSH-type Zn-finger protein